MTHLVTRIRVYYLIGLAMIIGVGFWAAYKADHWIRMESGGSTPDFWSQYQTFMIPGILVGLMAGWVMSWAVRREVSGMLERLMDAFGSLQRGRPQPMRTQAGTKEEKVLAECFNHALSMVQQAQEQQFKNAMTDSLTGLMNRAGLKKQLDNDVQDESVALLFIDLDDFKRVNDVFGHEIGDETLKVTARRIQDSIRSSGVGRVADRVARIGGDEFVILLNPEPAPEYVNQISQRVIDAICQPIALDGREIFVGASIGLASGCTQSEMDTVINRADMAMYQAKAGGKRTFVRFDESMEKDIQRMAEVERCLRHAIQQNELTVLYQALVRPEGRIGGFEALVRWKSAELGPVSPAEFIPVAEAYGMIEDIDLWIARQAMRGIRMRMDAWGEGAFVSINASGMHFLSMEFADQLISIAQQEDIDPYWVHIEITETAILQDMKAAKAAVQRLREAGFRIYLDDFGTGYSSLSHLSRFPLDGLKVDVSFVRDIPTSAGACNLARGIIDLAHNLDLGVVCEGVETPEQAEFLTMAEADLLQGWYFGSAQPLPSSLSAKAAVPTFASGSVEAVQQPA